ncbi:adenylyltransferase/cytidyltransferase family protein [Desulfobacter vibrioformis]|uniref:adenylyltransferase/cytidyltransferase family protein n=1 Tax=Desulfobacter vibrioformis TaxID=34031 RepID=UPI000A9EA30F|nr:adenylyltransferase/cytidyltransferase family protein [Desulfobacter vibrioformis]
MVLRRIYDLGKRTYFLIKYRDLKNSLQSLIEEEIKKESIINYYIPVLKAAKRYVEDNGGSILFVNRPIFPFFNLSKNEKQIRSIRWNNRILLLLYNLGLIDTGAKEKLMRNVKQPRFKIVTPNKLRKNYMVNEDCENKFVRVINGYRQNPRKALNENANSIYVFGSSHVYSIYCRQESTLTALLEKEINDPNIHVYNRGVLAADSMNSAFAILDTEISKGDMVILYGLSPLSEGEKIKIKNEVDFLDLAEIFIRPHNYGDVFYDSRHLTPAGNKIVAKFLAKAVKENLATGITKDSFSEKEKNIFQKIDHCRYRAAIRYVDDGFPDYIKSLKSKYKPGNNGIAAMNCNPFTLGHKYLVSTAAKMVDTLYVFVLEEDKSYFSFKQRFQMIKEGLKEITNVELVPSGKFLVSSFTFPDYFSKEEIFNPAMDVDYDFELFIDYIAPALNLASRFIGNEPFCQTTRTHSEIMKKTLPPKGISVIEIERLENEFGPISASKVRELIKNKEFEKLDSFLPRTSLDLLTMFGYLN